MAIHHWRGGHPGVRDLDVRIVVDHCKSTTRFTSMRSCQDILHGAVFVLECARGTIARISLSREVVGLRPNRDSRQGRITVTDWGDVPN